MMRPISHRSLPSLLVVLVAMLAFPSIAGASAQDVLKDFGPDGVIDGDFTLAELQAADKLVTPQEREYQFWDDAYAAAVDRLSNPDAPLPPPTVVPVDTNDNGRFDESEVIVARKATAKLRDERGFTAEGLPDSAGPLGSDAGDLADGFGGGGDTDVGESKFDDDELTAPSASRGDDDGGNGWLLALLLVPIAIIAFGTMRLHKTRKRRAVAAAGGFAPAKPSRRAKRSRDKAARRAKRRRGGDDIGGGSSSYRRDAF